MIGGTSVHISIKLGAYAGRSTNISLTGMNNPSLNLTNVYLDAPLVGPKPEPLDYVPSPGRLGQPIGYPRISTGGAPSTDGSKKRPPSPTPTYSPHPKMNPLTGRAQPRRVMQLAMVPDKKNKIW